MPQGRADRVRLIVARVEPLLVLGLGTFLLTQVTSWRQPAMLLVVGILLIGAGTVGVVVANGKPIVEARLWLGLLAAVAIGIFNRTNVLDLLAWFAIFGLAPPLVLGLRRASPAVALATISMALGSWHVFDIYAGVIRGLAVVLGGVLFGLIADSFEESDSVATQARRDARRAERREQQLRAVLDAAPIGIMVVGDSPENSFKNLEVADVTSTTFDANDRDAVKNLIHRSSG